MKKLLSLFAALGLAASTSATVVSCGPDKTESSNEGGSTGNGSNPNQGTTFDISKIFAGLENLEVPAASKTGTYAEKAYLNDVFVSFLDKSEFNSGPNRTRILDGLNAWVDVYGPEDGMVDGLGEHTLDFSVKQNDPSFKGSEMFITCNFTFKFTVIKYI